MRKNNMTSRDYLGVSKIGDISCPKHTLAAIVPLLRVEAFLSDASANGKALGGLPKIPIGSNKKS
jgi:hypothetical protein